MKDDIRIVVLDKGFIFCGEYEQRGDRILVRRAVNIKKYGTEKGLGSLRADPESPTLNAWGIIDAPKKSEILTIYCNKEKWEPHLIPVVQDDKEFRYIDEQTDDPSKERQDMRIVILDKGFVVAGDYEHIGDRIVVDNCVNLRRYGTEEGIGYLRNDPSPADLDNWGLVDAPHDAEIFTIYMDPVAWRPIMNGVAEEQETVMAESGSEEDVDL
ncbi:MAG: hypothetical protein OEY01_03840 [Desulfobulbaceae bacterium]|nr:hypothetical protein [Desulfobulbaceae bacterium]